MRGLNTAIVHAEVRIKALYECSVCGRFERGDTIRRTFTGTTSDCIKRQIDDIDHSPYQMPVGWSHGARGYTCQQHK